MRLAVVSDIHGNRHAFESVLADIATQSPDRILSLGDNIGYGAEPEAVLQLLRFYGIRSILGNHELAVIDPSIRKWFNPLARKSIRHAARVLSADSMAYLRTLPVSMEEDRCWFVHGFPPDSPTTYLFQADDDDIRQGVAATGCPICFVGHTHTIELASIGAAAVDRHALSAGPVTLDPGNRYLVNIGSVGQPRDGNREAKYALFDASAARLEIRYVTYDREAAARAIIAAGLPPAHAARLL